MPLSEPVAREALHHRAIDCHGYRREDGLWDIEAHIVDTKTYGFENSHRGRIEPGDAIHDMWLRLTVDDSFVIHRAEAATDASPFAICPAITPAFTKLEGLTLGHGWSRAVRQRLGGVNGCTHLVELLRPLATVVFQTIFRVCSRRPRSRFLNVSCVARFSPRARNSVPVSPSSPA